jgi:cell division protease FtsH
VSDFNNKDDKKKDIKPPFNQNPNPSRIALIALILVAILFLYFFWSNQAQGSEQINYDFFRTQIQNDRIISDKNNPIVILQNGKISGVYRDEAGKDIKFNTMYPLYLQDNGDLYNMLNEKKINYRVDTDQNPFLSMFIFNILPIAFLIFIIWFMFRQFQGAGNKAFTFGKSRARKFEPKEKITFNEVAGIDEAKQELAEVVEFLKDPQKFTKIGAKIPKGVLLVGPPGTGKTLLARAVAGEAGVDFFHMSGSDFVEMFVGVGASRVRDLFEQGRKSAPCILFIDELDAVGRTRGAGYGGGHDEREQTLNQLLVEMDGFDPSIGVILLAATNRADVLDPALLRPGRFDRQVVVDRPDVKGREEIFKIHVRKIALSKNVDLIKLAKATPGFSGADIANMVNEAALLAARFNKSKVSMEDFEESRDKVMMGVARKSRIIPEKIKRITAFHEAGHALVSIYLDHTDTLHKVSVIPRGMALGITFHLPDDDKIYTKTKDETLDLICMAMGGRAAEEIIFNRFDSGAAQDIATSTDYARKMVSQWGMSDKLGPISYGQKDEPIFLGKEIATHKDYSEKTAQMIDEEMKKIIDDQYKRAKGILEEHKDQLIKFSETLFDRETMDAEEIYQLLEIPQKKNGETISFNFKTVDEDA